MKFHLAILMAGLLVTGAAYAADGAKVYNNTCMNCHGAGVMGAPKLGDKAAWAPRISQGKAALYEHAMNGYKGMPAKGGDDKLSSTDVKAAVDYMVEHSS